MNGLCCRKCDSKNTQTLKAKDADKKMPDAGFENVKSGFIKKEHLGGLIEMVTWAFKALATIFGFLEEKEKKEGLIVICKDCGYWERI